MKSNKKVFQILIFTISIIISGCSVNGGAGSSKKLSIPGKDIIYDGVLKRPPVGASNVKALGVPAYITKKSNRFSSIITRSTNLGLNALVVNFKDVDPRGDIYRRVAVTNYITDSAGKKIAKVTYERKLIPRHMGNVYFETKNPMVAKIGASRLFIKDVSALQKKLWRAKLELAARFCLFGDWKYANHLRKSGYQNRDTLVIKNRKQSRWLNPDIVSNLKSDMKFPVTITNLAKNKKHDDYFVDPLNPEVLEYNLSLIKELYDYGIRIFVFDYVRMEDPYDTKNYSPKIFFFNHVALEQSLKYLKSELDKYRKKNNWGPEPVYAVSVFGRVLFNTYNGTMDPVGQNIRTINEIGFKISSMDYTHLLLKEWRQKPYEGRMLYLKYGMEKIPKDAFIPWVDCSARSAPKDQKVKYVYKELKAVLDSGLNSYFFWIPSGHHKEFNRVFDALTLLK